MSMMNANAAATTTMTANEPLDFELPEIGEAEFSNEELAEDMDGLTMSFPRIKIPAGGVLQFEIPNGDPQHPDYRPTLTGVILYNHASCAYWPEGDEYNDDVPPLCSSVDGKGYQTNEIAQMQNTSLYHVNTLLDNARFIVVELCRDA